MKPLRVIVEAFLLSVGPGAPTDLARSATNTPRRTRYSHPTSRTTRWLDRIVPDGAWSGNLYDFFRRVIRKLTEDLKVPFVLQDGARVDDTPAHQALREALVNTLIHADYSGRASVLVVKQPSGFVFRNPGMMRVPAAQALAGGASDCRNRTLHQMFLFINLGERAGSGLPKIRAGWEAMGHALHLADAFEPFEQTTLEMTWAGGLIQDLAKTPLKTPEKILAAMRGQADITIPELALLLNKSESAVKRAIRKLRDAGQIGRAGGDKGGRWVVRSSAQTFVLNARQLPSV